MRVKELIEKLQAFDGEMEVILFFNAGDDMFYEDAGNVREGYLAPEVPYCYLDIASVKEDFDGDIADLDRVVAIVA